jgi:hypothetical protein
MNIRIALIFAAIILASYFPSYSQATAYANIFAKVVEPGGVGKTADLTFNENISSKMAVVDETDSNNPAVVKAQTVQTKKGTLTTFTVMGGKQSTFDITLSKDSFIVGSEGDHKMIVSNFTSAHSGGNGLEYNINEIEIGATLKVSGNPTAAIHSTQNPFLVVVNYN